MLVLPRLEFRNRIIVMTRNLSIHITPEQKEELKALAKDSNLTLSAYIEAVLNEAVLNKDKFEIKIRKLADKVAEPALHG